MTQRRRRRRRRRKEGRKFRSFQRSPSPSPAVVYFVYNVCA